MDVPSRCGAAARARERARATRAQHVRNSCSACGRGAVWRVHESACMRCVRVAGQPHARPWTAGPLSARPLPA
eukprot:3146868-Prymnesium_polylepis.1